MLWGRRQFGSWENGINCDRFLAFWRVFSPNNRVASYAGWILNSAEKWVSSIYIKTMERERRWQNLHERESHTTPDSWNVALLSWTQSRREKLNPDKLAAQSAEIFMLISSHRTSLFARGPLSALQSAFNWFLIYVSWLRDSIKVHLPSTVSVIQIKTRLLHFLA